MNFLHKLLGIAQDVDAQVNPFDGGMTYKTVQKSLNAPPIRPGGGFVSTVPRRLSELPTQDAATGETYGQKVGTSVFSVGQSGVPYYDPTGATSPKWTPNSYLAVPLKSNLQPMQRIPYTR